MRSRQHAREEVGQQEELALIALSTQLEKAGETVQLALYRTNRAGRSAHGISDGTQAVRGRQRRGEREEGGSRGEVEGE